MLYFYVMKAMLRLATNLYKAKRYPSYPGPHTQFHLFPPPKASYNLSFFKKKKKTIKTLTNPFLSRKSFELLLHCCKSERSPIQPYWRGSPTNFHVPRQLCSSFSSPTKLAQKIKILYFLFFSHIFLASKLINHSDLQNKKTCT